MKYLWVLCFFATMVGASQSDEFSQVENIPQTDEQKRIAALVEQLTQEVVANDESIRILRKHRQARNHQVQYSGISQSVVQRFRELRNARIEQKPAGESRKDFDSKSFTVSGHDRL